jgi:hypothetical protein
MELLTPHARTRMQQRGIRPEAIEALLDFGREVRAGRGRDLVFFDKRARARLARAGVRGAEIDRMSDSYAILGADGKVITVGHRYRRVPRER